MITNTIKSTISWISEITFPLILIIIAAMILQFIGSKLIKNIIRKTVQGHHIRRPKQPLADVVKRQDTIIGVSLVVWRVIVFIGAALGSLGIVFPHINFFPVFASAGVIGAVIGFGAQSIVKDTIAGIFIIAENQFRVGDTIDLEGPGVTGTGTVEHISLRSTVLRDNSGNVHYVSNGSILHTINKTMGYSKVNFSIAVHPSSDVDQVAKIIDKVGLKLADDSKWKSKIIEAPHFVNLGSFNDTALEINITGKTVAGEQWSVTSELKKELLKQFHTQSEIKLAQYTTLNFSSISGKKK